MTRLMQSAAVAALLAFGLAAPAQAQRHQPQRPQMHQPSFHNAGVSHRHGWRTGQRLAPNQRRYVVNDWQRRGLRTPPRGYRWVREDNNSGDYLLVAVATGLIASILAQQ